MSDSGAKGNTGKESTYPDNNTQDNESNDCKSKTSNPFVDL